MMKKLILFFVFCAISNFLIAQDIIVLKKDESVIKCRIIQINEAKISYHSLEKSDTTTYILKRSEVLSFLFDENSGKNEIKNSAPATIYGVESNLAAKNESSTGKKKKDKPIENDTDNKGLLAQYKTGEKVPGYILNINNDTLRGTILPGNVAMNQLEIKFIDEQGKTFTYGTNDINGYSYGEVNYRKVKSGYKKEIVNGKKSENGIHFLHVEVDGPAKLYRFYTLKFKQSTLYADPNTPDYFGKLKYYFLLTNPKGKQILTKGKTIKGSVNRLYSDDKILVEEVRNNGVKVHHLAQLIKDYNTRWMKSQKQ